MKVLQDILKSHTKIAMLIGNGPNLASALMPSWKQLLRSVSNPSINFEIEGLSNTEVYDFVDLHSIKNHDVKLQVINQLKLLPNKDISVHGRLMNLAKQYNAPVLTTNFDEAFEKSIDAQLYRTRASSFTRFYPWDSYYGFKKHQLPTDGFGIWKIHGDVRYKDSIRLGLTDYMGAVERARALIHKEENRLFNTNRQSPWRGYKTWLHLWFHLPIIIFGLGFSKDEIFLRWLLIEKKRYCNAQQKPMEAYFVSKDNLDASVKNLMKNLDVNLVTINDYSELYG